MHFFILHTKKDGKTTVLTGDEGIEPPPKVLETPIIPFDQSPIAQKKAYSLFPLLF